MAGIAVLLKHHSCQASPGQGVDERRGAATPLSFVWTSSRGPVTSMRTFSPANFGSYFFFEM